MFKKTLTVVSLSVASLVTAVSVAAENVDLLIKNATVLTMDDDRRVLEKGLVAVRGNKIVAVSDSSDIKQYEAKKVIDAEGGIVMPGMINTHTHVSMAVFRSLADDVPDRLRRY
ncbi:MAG: amidohydrolase, partial [Gammaproteobacteria bacterium]|nr:amidohydrolase [Phycisphaerae bacterium]NIQ74493.1 amidohydrolase [Gammaproteobacteria bacterium]NIW42259.1 amidohydrolase [candidate division Zixibacteria bacterium]NIR95665.1 amidohydrolase [Gammaproteobacteria bacterium]NIX31751.1 amidohydrolase [Phycisphaerae bacterium]